MDMGHLSKLERRRAGVSIEVLYRLARVLGVRELAACLAPYVDEAASE
jgi:transcriptional regulator with XRE-family HTH domain